MGQVNSFDQNDYFNDESNRINAVRSLFGRIQHQFMTVVLAGNVFRRSALLAVALILIGTVLGYSTYKQRYLGSASAPVLSQGHKSAPGTASPNACSLTSRANNLKISRVLLFVGHYTFAFPANETVVNVAPVQRLMVTLCSLPNAPRTILNCPADYGIQYRLDFLEGKKSVLNVKLDASGCRFVTGIEPRRISTTHLWTLLAQTMNLPEPIQYYYPFLGSYNGQAMSFYNSAKQIKWT